MTKTALLLACLGAMCARATTYYVSENGDDENDGLSAERAFVSFEKGASMLAGKPGNTLVVDEGLYSCDNWVRLAENSTVLGKGPGRTTVVFCGKESALAMANSSERSLVKGFTFTTLGPHASGLYTGADRAVLEDCVFADALAGQSGFGIVYFLGYRSHLKNVVITNCVTGRKTGGFFLNANRGVMENCRAEGNRFEAPDREAGANGYWRDYEMTIRNCSFGGSPMAGVPSFWEKTSGAGVISNCVFSSKNGGSADILKVGCRVGAGK